MLKTWKGMKNMKKWICLIMAMILTLSLCACGESGGKSVKGLQAGFGRVMIIPDYTVQLAGGAATRMSDGYQDALSMTFVALRENEETYLLCTMDVICAEDVFVDPSKAAIAEATGVPEENILMNATHTHASVAIRSNGSENVERYREEFFGWAVECAQEAIADLSPATVSYTATQAEGMAYVRHYALDNGTYAGSNFGSFSSGTIVGHSTDADTQMQLIKFARAAEDKKDIVLMNFPAHATMTQSNTTLSADFPAPFREYVEENADVLCAYFIAAAGDQVPGSKLVEETFSTDYRVYGEELGRIAVEAMNTMTDMEGSGIAMSTKTFTAGYNKEKLDMLAEAEQVKLVWDIEGRASDKGKAAAKEHGFASVYEVSAVLNRANAPDTNSMVIKALRLGNVSFIFAPYEMFGTQGMAIKENSPYPMTFIITCAEGAEGYLPSVKGWEIGSYESHVTKFERGSAEKLAEEFVSMLTELNQN